jgi:hypothetical protein
MNLCVKQTFVLRINKKQPMETKFYTCHFCKNEYEPTRRKIQKFCSDTCRTKNHYHKNELLKNKLTIPESTTPIVQNQEEKAKQKVEEISLQGVTNSFLGTLAAQGTIEFGKKAFSKPEKKPAKITEIQEQQNKNNQRYFPIRNMERRFDGALPYFDLATASLIYLGGKKINSASYTI